MLQDSNNQLTRYIWPENSKENPDDDNKIPKQSNYYQLNWNSLYQKIHVQSGSQQTNKEYLVPQIQQYQLLNYLSLAHQWCHQSRSETTMLNNEPWTWLDLHYKSTAYSSASSHTEHTKHPKISTSNEFIIKQRQPSEHKTGQTKQP